MDMEIDVRTGASISSGTTDGPMVSFKELLCLTPRGRFNFEILPSCINLHGKTNDFRIPLISIPLLFLLPHKNSSQMYFVLSLQPPVKHGKTKYPFCVFLIGRHEQTSITLNLSERDIKERFGDELQKEMSGLTFEVLGRVMRAVTKRKIRYPGSFTGISGSPALACSYRSDSGFLYPLEMGLIYVYKPTVHIKLNEIRHVKFARIGGNTKSFDLEVVTKDSCYVFSGIEKEEYGKLYAFAEKKNLLYNVNSDKKQDFRDKGPDSYSRTVKMKGQQRGEERFSRAGGMSSDDSSDESFAVAESESEVDEEYDSSPPTHSESEEEMDSRSSDGSDSEKIKHNNSIKSKGVRTVQKQATRKANENVAKRFHSESSEDEHDGFLKQAHKKGRRRIIDEESSDEDINDVSIAHTDSHQTASFDLEEDANEKENYDHVKKEDTPERPCMNQRKHISKNELEHEQQSSIEDECDANLHGVETEEQQHIADDKSIPHSGSDSEEYNSDSPDSEDKVNEIESDHSDLHKEENESEVTDNSSVEIINEIGVSKQENVNEYQKPQYIQPVPHISDKFLQQMKMEAHQNPSDDGSPDEESLDHTDSKECDSDPTESSDSEQDENETCAELDENLKETVLQEHGTLGNAKTVRAPGMTNQLKMDNIESECEQAVGNQLDSNDRLYIDEDVSTGDDRKTDNKDSIIDKPIKEPRKRKPRKKNVKDPNKPKRAPSSFFFYLNEIRGQIKIENPSFTVTETTRRAGQMWKEVSDKTKWLDAAALAKKDYLKAMEVYKATIDDTLKESKQAQPVYSEDETDAYLKQVQLGGWQRDVGGGSNHYYSDDESSANSDNESIDSCPSAYSGSEDEDNGKRSDGFKKKEELEGTKGVKSFNQPGKKRRRRKKKERDVNKPKRAQSSFLLFLAEKREQIKKDNPSISFTETTKKAGEMWREQSDKSKWLNAAAIEKNNYKVAMEVYKARVSAEGLDKSNDKGSITANEPGIRKRRKRKERDENRPKRAPSSFLFFLGEIKEQIKIDNPGISYRELTKRAGELWKAETDKSKWVNAATAAKDIYWKSMKEYKANVNTPISNIPNIKLQRKRKQDMLDSPGCFKSVECSSTSYTEYESASKKPHLEEEYLKLNDGSNVKVERKLKLSPGKNLDNFSNSGYVDSSDCGDESDKSEPRVEDSDEESDVEEQRKQQQSPLNCLNSSSGDECVSSSASEEDSPSKRLFVERNSDVVETDLKAQGNLRQSPSNGSDSSSIEECASNSDSEQESDCSVNLSEQ